MTGRIEARLAERKIVLPKAGAPLANYVPFVRSGSQLYIAGQICQWEGERRHVGKLGGAIGTENGIAAARLCGLNILAQAKAALDGDLDRILRCIKLCGFVNSQPDFTEQARIINGCSDLMVEVLGDAGRHARTAIGTNVLPFDVAVEIDALFEVQ